MSSHVSQDAQTAEEFIENQLRLESDAHQALPYQFDTCTRPLGRLRQLLFSCLTCNPPQENEFPNYRAAGVCYSCSISCHGDHDLVELFTKRDFVCDCGTTRFPTTAVCTLQINPDSGLKGGVHSIEPCAANAYNKNFRNRFCQCDEQYDPSSKHSTMFQCLGLSGGCGEDWWHADCIMGKRNIEKSSNHNGFNEVGLPTGFPDEDEFESFICYRCIEANPWIKCYAAAQGFIRVKLCAAKNTQVVNVDPSMEDEREKSSQHVSRSSFKRRLSQVDTDDKIESPEPLKKRTSQLSNNVKREDCRRYQLEQGKDFLDICKEQFSLFLKRDFRDQFCKCCECFPYLQANRILLEDIEIYEPPLSDDEDSEGRSRSQSLLDLGEAALSNVDRVRAIEGVMAYNHVKEKVKAFLQPFADSGTPVSAEDIKAYFERLRGDRENMLTAARMAGSNSADNTEKYRREGEGY